MVWRSGRTCLEDLRSRAGGSGRWQRGAIFKVSISDVCKALARRSAIGIAAALPKSGRPARRSGGDLNSRIAHVTFSPTWLNGRRPGPAWIVPRNQLSNSDRARRQGQKNTCSGVPRVCADVAYITRQSTHASDGRFYAPPLTVRSSAIGPHHFLQTYSLEAQLGRLLTRDKFLRLYVRL